LPVAACHSGAALAALLLLFSLRCLVEQPFRASLQLPNSFAIGDGIASHKAGAEATSEDDAVAQVCKDIMIELLLLDAAHYPNSKVCLSQEHWAIPVGDLLIHAAAATSHQPWVACAHPALANALLAVSTWQTRAAAIYYESTSVRGEQQGDADIAGIVRALIINERAADVFRGLRMIQWHGKWTTTWMVLARLVQPRGLVQWIQDHQDEFFSVMEYFSAMDGQKLRGFRPRQSQALCLQLGEIRIAVQSDRHDWVMPSVTMCDWLTRRHKLTPDRQFRQCRGDGNVCEDCVQQRRQQDEFAAWLETRRQLGILICASSLHHIVGEVLMLVHRWHDWERMVKALRTKTYCRKAFITWAHDRG
jgi:hypothetical protein